MNRRLLPLGGLLVALAALSAAAPPGKVRVEVRGRRGSGRDVVVYGAMDRPAVAAGAVAAVAALQVAEGGVAAGAAGLASRVAPVPFLTELRRRGVRAAVFAGDLAP